MCEQIIAMPNLRQLYVMDCYSEFRWFYKERNLDVMVAVLQYFNRLTSFVGGNIFMQVCPTGKIDWLAEFASTTRPLDRQFLVDVFELSFEGAFEFAKEYVHALHLNADSGEGFTTKFNFLRDLRLSYTFLITETRLRSSLEHYLSLVPNVQNIQCRFLSNKIFEEEQWTETIMNVMSTFAQKNNPSRTIFFELSAYGEPSSVINMQHFSKNLKVVVKSFRNDEAGPEAYNFGEDELDPEEVQHE